MGASAAALPITTRAITVGRLALCGIPFLAGYYSKDFILEAAQYSITKKVRVVLAMVATLMTAAYRARIVYFLALSPPTADSSAPISEENIKLTFPLIRLLIGVFVAG